MAIRPRKTDAAIDGADGADGANMVIESPAVESAPAAEPAPLGALLPGTVDEQLAGQIALASAEDRLNAEIEAGKRAVAEAEARQAAATVE